MHWTNEWSVNAEIHWTNALTIINQTHWTNKWTDTRRCAELINILINELQLFTQTHLTNVWPVANRSTELLSIKQHFINIQFFIHYSYLQLYACSNSQWISIVQHKVNLSFCPPGSSAWLDIPCDFQFLDVEVQAGGGNWVTSSITVVSPRSRRKSTWRERRMGRKGTVSPSRVPTCQPH